MSSLKRRSHAKSESFGVNRAVAPSAPFLPKFPQVTILLCTYNGARFLPAQLASLEQQTHWNWRLIVADDGSTDATLAILHHFAARVFQPVEVRCGPGKGPAANFIALASDPDIGGELFAFCDQDDVWHPSKLSRALGWLQAIPSDVPAAYGARTRLVSADGTPYGQAPLFRRQPHFSNALSQSIAGANTMVFNAATKRLFERAGPLDIVSHDWWTYQLVTGSGGTFHYDPIPHLDYRQHCDNRVGCNRGLRAQWRRLRMILDGRFARWNDLNVAALQSCRTLLTQEAATLLDAYGGMRGENPAVRLKAFFTSGIRRQSLLGDIALLLAIIFRKI